MWRTNRKTKTMPPFFPFAFVSAMARSLQLRDGSDLRTEMSRATSSQLQADRVRLYRALDRAAQRHKTS